jgi:NAD(P)-dependent dehydrogenase (short-subunit alcohol dehydrogenase family)
MDINGSFADGTVRIIEEEAGTALACESDATTPAGAAAAVQKCVTSFGGIDVLVNNFALAPLGGVVDTDLSEWERVFSANVTSAFLMCKEAVPRMIEGGGGSIVSVSSMASTRWTGVPMAAYASSKAALNQLSQYVALQHASQGIRSNVIVTGMILTPMVIAPMQSHFKTDVEEMLRIRDKLVPSGKMGTAWDVAYLAGFLCSDESKFINGAAIPLDGGMSCQIKPPEGR